MFFRIHQTFSKPELIITAPLIPIILVSFDFDGSSLNFDSMFICKMSGFCKMAKRFVYESAARKVQQLAVTHQATMLSPVPYRVSA